MPEITQVSNLLPPSVAAQLPLNIRQEMLAGQLAQQQAAAPTGPYTSRTAGMLKALEGGLGGLMEGSAVNRAMQGQRQAGADTMQFLDAAQQARAAAAGPGTAAPAAPSGGGMNAAAPGGDATRDLAIRTIYGEAGGESPTGQAGVAAVLRNRLTSGQYGPDMQSVIMAPKQFSLWNAGDPAGDTARRLSPSSPAYQRIGQIYDGVMSGKVPDPTNGATHYYNPKAASPDWGPALAKQNDVTIGNHRFVGGGGGPGQVGQADMPAPNAKPVASSVLPPGITPDMVSGGPAPAPVDLSAGLAGSDPTSAPAPTPTAPPPASTPSRSDLLANALDAMSGPASAGPAVVPSPQASSDPVPPPPPAPDPIAAAQMQGRDVAMDPVVPDPQGSLVPPVPSSPNEALQGPQSDAAMGNGAPAPEPSLRDTIMAAMGGGGAPPSGPQSDAAMGNGVPPPPTPAPPPADLSAGLAGSDPTGAMAGFSPSDGAPPAPEPSLRDTIVAAMNGTPDPNSGGLPATGPLPPQGGQSADPGSPLDMSAKAAIAPGISGQPADSTGGSTPVPTLLGSNVPPVNLSGAPSSSVAPLVPGAGSGSPAPASVPLPPLRPSDAALGLNPDAPAPGAAAAGPASVPPSSPLASALDAWTPSGNAPPGKSPLSDPSSPQAFQRQQALAAALGGGQAPGGSPAPRPAPSGFMGSLASLFSGGQAGPQAGAQPYPQGTPQQANAIAGQTLANPSANPAARQMAGQVQAATGGPSDDMRAMGARILSDPYQSSEVKQMVLGRLYPQMSVQKMDNGDLVQFDPTGQTAPRILLREGKFAAAHNGVIYNEGTGLGPGQNADGTGGAPSSNFRPATPAERAGYGVQDGRPMFIGPGGEPHFGEPQPAGQGETAEAKTAGEGAAARRGDMLAAADAAPEKIARLSLLGKVLDATQTGPLAGETGTAAAVGQRLGVSPERMQQLGIDPNQAVNTAVANKLAGEMTMTSIGAKNGGMPASNFSVAERQFIEGLYPNIENQPGANRAVTDVLTAMEQRKLQIADGWSAYKDQQRQAGQPLSYEDFEDSFRRAHAGDNIFAPIAQKYQAGGYTPNVPGTGGASTPQPQGGAPTASAVPPQGMGQPSGMAAQQGAPQAQVALTQAQAAIARGAPRAAVIQRLQSMGINPAGL